VVGVDAVDDVEEEGDIVAHSEVVDEKVALLEGHARRTSSRATIARAVTTACGRSKAVAKGGRGGAGRPRPRAGSGRRRRR
jgi:hypothetical protein